jgi:hypothetical protein
MRTRSVTVERAEVSFVVVEIELGAGGHMRRENFRIDSEVRHREWSRRDASDIDGQSREAE